jgi:hypothetical protein
VHKREKQKELQTHEFEGFAGEIPILGSDSRRIQVAGLTHTARIGCATKKRKKRNAETPRAQSSERSGRDSSTAQAGPFARAKGKEKIGLLRSE